MPTTKFNKFPVVNSPYDTTINLGWKAVTSQINQSGSLISNPKKVIAIEFYQGVLWEEVVEKITNFVTFDTVIFTPDLMYPESYFFDMVYPFVTDDRIFGVITTLTIDQYFDPEKIRYKKLYEQEGVEVLYQRPAGEKPASHGHHH